MRRLFLIAMGMAGISAPAQAEWQRTDKTSDALAVAGAQLLAAASRVVPYNNYYITVDVTYWRMDGNMYRCTDTNNQGYRQCEVAIDDGASRQ